jgi:hypothetical protein
VYIVDRAEVHNGDSGLYRAQADLD